MLDASGHQPVGLHRGHAGDPRPRRGHERPVDRSVHRRRRRSVALRRVAPRAASPPAGGDRGHRTGTGIGTINIGRASVAHHAGITGRVHDHRRLERRPASSASRRSAGPRVAGHAERTRFVHPAHAVRRHSHRADPHIGVARRSGRARHAVDQRPPHDRPAGAASSRHGPAPRRRPRPPAAAPTRSARAALHLPERRRAGPASPGRAAPPSPSPRAELAAPRPHR